VRGLAEKLRSAVVWNVSFNLLRDVLQFATMLVLVRLLEPEAYGQFALVTSVVSFVAVLSMNQFVAYTLQVGEGEDPRYQEQFTAGRYAAAKEAFERAFAAIAKGTVLISVADSDKPAVVEVARRFSEIGFKIKATTGTRRCLADAGIESEPIFKLHEDRPNIADALTDGEIQLVINTPSGKASKQDDSYIRTTAVRRKVPHITTLAAALAAAKGIAAFRDGRGELKSLQEYHAGVKS